MFRLSRKKELHCQQQQQQSSDMVNSTTTLYRHQLSNSGGNKQNHNNSSFSSTDLSSSVSSITSSSLSSSTRSLSIGTSSTETSSSSSSMNSCLPPIILTRSIPDGDDKYGTNYKSLWMRLGWYSDNSPRPPNRNVHYHHTGGGNISSTDGAAAGMFKQRFMIFISFIAFMRVSNTFYMYKTSLDQILRGYEPSSSGSSNNYNTRYLSSMVLNNDMMSLYYHGNHLYSDDGIDDHHPRKKNPRVTFDDLLDHYNIPSLLVPQYDISKAMEKEGFDPWMLTDDNDMHTRIHTIRDTHREQRQQRTRPPSIVSSSTTSTADESTVWTVVHPFPSSVERENVGKVTTIDIASGNSNNVTTNGMNEKQNWSDLCKNAKLTKASRVIITNALSVSIGSPLTLLLSKQCGVKNIMIVDSMFPNTKRRRAIMMDTYRTLFRNVLTLQFTNPTNTAGLAKMGSESATDWMEKFEPTHIVHLEDLDGTLDSDENWGEYMSKKGQQLLHLQSSLLPLQQIMHYIHHKEKTNKLNVLHVTLSSILSDSSSTTPSKDDGEGNIYSIEHLHKTSVTHDVNAMMADYLYTMQQFGGGSIDESNMLQMHHLKLPNVYGPIMNGKLNDRSKKVHDNGNSLYLDDAMVGIFKALHLSQDDDRQILTISAAQVTEASSVWRQDLTFAYDLDVEHPFGGTEQQHYLSTMTSFNHKAYESAMTWVNDMYGIYNPKFPCASSCVDNTDMTTCDSSVWDTVYPVSQSITDHCVNVMYYVNLDPTLETIPGSPEVITPSDKKQVSDNVCRIVFVSGSSTVAIDTLLQGREAKNEKTLNDAEALREYNGKLSMNGWTLVWIPDITTATITESDRSLIRIDPSRFFASSVQKAVYVESDDIMTLSDDDVMELILSNAGHEEHTETYQTMELRDGFDDLYRSVEHPPSNARSVSFLASELPLDTRPNNPAQYMEQLTNRVGAKDVKGRHLNYYKQMNHYIQVDMNRPVEDSDGSSPFIWISRKYFVHNLQSEEGHIFRCTWYDAHMYWGPESVVRDSEELSLAYIVAKQRIEGSIGYPLDDDPTWFPQLNKYTGEQINVVTADGKETTTTEAFIRFVTGESEETTVEEDESSTTVVEVDEGTK